LPGFISILALSFIYALYGNVGLVAGLFFGLKAAVLAIVLQAVVRIGSRALKNNVMVGLAAAAFIAIFFFDVPFPLIILTAAAVGFLGGRAGNPAFLVDGGHGGYGKGLSDADSALGDTIPAHAKPSVAWSVRVSSIFLFLWLGPVLVLLLALGPDDIFTSIAVFFSKMAVVTFGGAYAVLAYVAQEAVQSYGWLAPGEMLDGLGMAETTPGPLIQVVQFVGFMGAFRDPGLFDPLVAATLAAVLTTWVTFVPCFLWIFLGAPFIETIRGNKALSAALAVITAAVVGVVLNLAVWFALHVLFGELRNVQALGMSVDVPVWQTVNVAALLLTTAALLAVFRFRIGMIKVLSGCAAVGIVYYLAAGAAV
jgi:chromate transporter